MHVHSTIKEEKTTLCIRFVYRVYNPWNFNNHMFTVHSMQFQSPSRHEHAMISIIETCKPWFTIRVICNKSINPDDMWRISIDMSTMQTTCANNVEFQRNSSEIQVLQCCKAPKVCIRVVYTVEKCTSKRGKTTIIQFNSCMNRACTVAGNKR